MEFEKLKVMVKKVSMGMLFTLMIFATIMGASAEDMADEQISAEIATLPDAGVTPNSPMLWNFELFGENIKEKFLSATASKERQNEFRLNRINERISELATVTKDEAKTKKVMDIITHHQMRIQPINSSMEELKHSFEVLQAVKERLAAKGIEPKGLDVALGNQLKLYDASKADRLKKMPKATTTDAYELSIVEDEEF
jgi:hypothetical protein